MAPKIIPISETLTANPERGEVLVPVLGTTYKLRFGLRFLAEVTRQTGGNGPADALGLLATAPLAALLDMAVLALRLAVPPAALPDGYDLAEALEDLPAEDLQHLFAVLMQSITAHPILAALTPKAA